MRELDNRNPRVHSGSINEREKKRQSRSESPSGAGSERTIFFLLWAFFRDEKTGRTGMTHYTTIYDTEEKARADVAAFVANAKQAGRTVTADNVAVTALKCPDGCFVIPNKV